MIVPKKHVDHFIDLDDDLAMHICLIGNKIGQRIYECLKPMRVGFAVAGFGVAHAHYHVVPMWDMHDVTSGKYAISSADRVVFSMDHISFADPADQEELASLLKI